MEIMEMNMKKIVITLAAISLIASQMNAQLVLENEAAVVYYMPKNEVVITLDYDIVEHTPGIFYQYAERYLGAKDVIAEAETTYQLSHITTHLISMADIQREYKVTAIPGGHEQYLTLTEDGRLLGYGLEPSTRCAHCQLEDTSKVCQESSNEVKSAQLELMPLLEEQFLASSVAKMAEGAAKQIYRIREMRLNLLAGEVEHVPADGEAMRLVLDELNNREQALIDLFVGKTVVRHKSHTMKYIPIECVDKAVLCRFSMHSGVVAADDLSGEPIYICVDATQELVQANMEQNTKAPALSQIYYNLPGHAELSIAYKGKEMAHATYEIAQLGVAIPLAKELFTGKQRPVILINPQTGNIQSIHQ